MKRTFTFLISLLTALSVGAQGWPSQYEGVMLQGFWWDSYSDTRWTNLEQQADELSQYFNLIWVPQSGYCNTTTMQMGYSDIWWLDHKSAFGMAAQHRLLGGDVSLLPSYEAQGTVYRDAGGQSVALLPFLRAQGCDALRVRLFVEPQYAPQNHREEGVCQDLGYVISLGRRIRQAGFQLLLDLHYSDFWADPGKQTMPHLWRDTRREDLPDSVYQYTRRTLLAMKRQGVVPQLIQVGNETTNGMLWPQGRIDWKQGDRGWDYLCQLYQAGCRACREVCPQARIVIHTEKPGSWDITRTYYQQLRRHCVDYDLIGLSYYPMWHGTIPNLVRHSTA